ncbi:MAG: hypothetical protein ACE5I1_08760, partial [bacterium]
VTLDSVRYTIIGVVEDVLNFGPWRPVKPSVFRLIEPEGFRYLTARIGTENLAETQTFLRSEWLRIAPDVPYPG